MRKKLTSKGVLFTSWEDAYVRPEGHDGVFWVIEYNTARADRFERVTDDEYYVSHLRDGVLEIMPMHDGPLPRHEIPAHMIAQVSRFPEIEAP